VKVGHFEILLTGFSIVLGVLIILWGVTSLIGLACRFSWSSHFKKPTVSENEGLLKADQGDPEGVPAHHLVAISAAVFAVFGPRSRTVRVDVPVHWRTTWAMEGRYRDYATRKVFTPNTGNR
jgi:glutaconyl-CoA/methylmalonyl-CoA decarboxylase subunit delta